MQITQWLESIVLAIHRRNGGLLPALDLNARLLDEPLLLDSLDLAEIMAAIEKEHGFSPFDAPTPPGTWKDIVEQIERAQSTPAQHAQHSLRPVPDL